MKLIYIIAILIGAVSYSCNGKQKSEQTKTNPASEMYLTAQDTAAVKQLVNLFMRHAKAHHIDSAVGILRHVDRSVSTKPVLLNETACMKAGAMLNKYPVLDYFLSDMAFYNAYHNEVLCHVKTTNGITIKLRFAPVRYLGRWSLCLKGIDNK